MIEDELKIFVGIVGHTVSLSGKSFIIDLTTHDLCINM